MNAEPCTQQQIAIKRNNEAVLQLSVGDFSEAIENLAFALNVYKQSMGEVTPQLEAEQPTTSLDQCMALCDAIHSQDIQGKHDCYVYQNGIHIPQDISCDYHSNVMVSTMIIFNLALAEQLAGSNIVDTSRKQAKLIKATQLYDLAFNMQQVEQLEDNVYFTLVTINNLGVIYQQLGDLEAATKCYENLLSTVMLVLDYGKTNPYFGCFAQIATGFMSKIVIAPTA